MDHWIIAHGPEAARRERAAPLVQNATALWRGTECGCGSLTHGAERGPIG